MKKLTLIPTGWSHVGNEIPSGYDPVEMVLVMHDGKSCYFTITPEDKQLTNADFCYRHLFPALAQLGIGREL